jgi:hypothetical protein
MFGPFILIFLIITVISFLLGAGRAVSVQRLGCGLDDRGVGVRFPAGAGYVSFLYNVQTGYGAHQVSYTMGIRGCFPEATRQEREADHSPPSSAKVKNDGAISLHGVVII